MSLRNNTGLSSNDSTRNMIRVLTKQRSGLNICHINAQSLVKKMDEFRYLFEESDVDIICISETWFNECVPDSLIVANGYKIFRNDRVKLGGGVAIYVKRHIHSKVVYRSKGEDNIEYLFLEITARDTKLLIGCTYRPNKNIPYENFLRFLEAMTIQYNDVVIASDFNSNILEGTDLISSLLSIGLHIVNTENPTHFTSANSSLLDIFIVSNTPNVLLYDQLCVPCFSKHDLIYLSFDFKLYEADNLHSFRDFRHIDYGLLDELFKSIAWNNIYLMVSAEEQLQFLNTSLHHIFEHTVPIRTYRGNKSKDCWFNSSIKNQINHRNELYVRWKRYRTSERYEEYRIARRNVSKSIRDAKSNYYANRFRSAVDSKKKWQTIKEIGIGNKMTTVDNVDVNELNELFINTPSTSSTLNQNSSIQQTNEETLLPTVQSTTPPHQFEFSCVTPADVLSCCLSVKSNAVGYDLLHPKFIKLLLPKLLCQITHIFNTILTTSHFPSCWKYAKIIPIPKSRSEYRPIAILPYLSKVFERILQQQMTSYLNDHCLLTENQSGFRPKHSCVTALLNVSDDIRFNIDNGDTTFLVLLDHSKAFDCVNHRILCSKLAVNFNFTATATSLLASYLSNRTQSVTVENTTSNPLFVPTGVPQGSILGPLLFSLYINDLPSQLSHCNIHIYADDVQIYISSKNDLIYECSVKLNEDLNKVSAWAASNGLYLNPKKSKCLVISKRNQHIPPDICITLGNQTIEFVESTKNLGIIFNKSLKWNTHVNAATGSTFAMLRTLYPTQHLTPIKIRELLAKTFIMPKLLYGCEIFASCDAGSKTRLNVAFNAILRYVYGIKRYDGTSLYSKSLYGVSFDDLLKIKSLIFLHKIIYTKEPNYLYNRLRFARSSRGRKLILTRHRSLISDWQFFINSVRLWNSLPPSTQLIGNAIQFKNKLFSSFS